jgi:hypothetical protein
VRVDEAIFHPAGHKKRACSNKKWICVRRRVSGGDAARRPGAPPLVASLLLDILRVSAAVKPLTPRSSLVGLDIDGQNEKQ